MRKLAAAKNTARVVDRVLSNVSRRPQFAQVLRVDGERVDIRVTESSAIAHNCLCLGETGQLKPGDTVQIAWWDGGRPVVLKPPDLKDHEWRIAELERRIKDIVISRGTPQPNFDMGLSSWKILRFHGGNLVSVHNPDEIGMNDALSISVADDLILLPAITLDMDCTVPQDIDVSGLARVSSIFNGKITLEDGATITKLTINGQIDDNQEVISVECLHAATIDDCEIISNSCCALDANGVLCSGTGKVKIEGSTIMGDTSVVGYAVNNAGATRVDVNNSIVFGRTSNFYGEVFVYSNTYGEPTIECPDVSSEDVVFFAQGLGVFVTEDFGEEAPSWSSKW